MENQHLSRNFEKSSWKAEKYTGRVASKCRIVIFPVICNMARKFPRFGTFLLCNFGQNGQIIEKLSQQLDQNILNYVKFLISVNLIGLISLFDIMENHKISLLL